MNKRTIVGICLFSCFLMLSMPLIPTVQSIEVEKEIQSNIKTNIQSMKDRLDSFDLLSYLVRLLRLILSFILLPISFIISIPGLIVLFFDLILLFILWPSHSYILGGILEFVWCIQLLFYYIGIYLSIPIIITLQVIDSNGGERFIDLLNSILNRLEGEVINVLLYLVYRFVNPSYQATIT